jgi:hypothetical protein
LLVVFGVLAQPLGAQQSPSPVSSSAPTQDRTQSDQATASLDSRKDPENRHIQIFRYSVAKKSQVVLPELGNESVMLCLKCESLRRIPAMGAPENWGSGPGSAMWNRGGTEFTLENLSAEQAELLVVEMKDSYAFSQVRVPSSEKDPMLVDSRHFRVMLENEHTRVLLMGLHPREGTENSQFPLRLEIALTDMATQEQIAGGKSREVTRTAGEAEWKTDEMKSFVNAGENPLQAVILELKHPFCYPWKLEGDPWEKDAALKTYFEHVKEMMGRKWTKKMPHSARDGQTGLLTLNLKLQLDGTIGEDDIGFQTVFASEELAEKAIAAVRDAGPYPPVPPSLGNPFMEMRMTFLYNLPREPQSGCH